MQIRYLLMLIVALTTLVLVFTFAFFFKPSVSDWKVALTIAVIPSLIATAVTALAFYFFIQRHGISSHEDATNKDGGLTINIETFRDELSVQIDRLEEKFIPDNQTKGVAAFYPNFNQVDWSQLIGAASQIDIVVSYYDSWVNSHREDLIAFFRRGGELRIFLGNPENELVMQVTEQRFPDNGREKLKEKIKTTVRRLEDARAAAKAGHVEGYLVDVPLNYSAIIFDSRQVLLSVYEQFRSSHIASSAVLIDINDTENTSLYWKKEIEGFQKLGAKI